MNAETAVAFAVAAVFAVGDWVACARRETSPAWPRVEYVCKPGTLAALVVAALVLDPVAGAGAALFAGSDSMIAWNRFVRPFPWAAVGIMVTYHLGQAALVASLLR